MEKRIAVHVFEDLILPLQRGKPGTKEREESNREIKQVFKNSRYSPEYDLGDAVLADGYYLTSEFRVEKDTVFFKGSDGKEYSAPKRWVIFEAEHPVPFKMWDEQRAEEPRE